MTPSWILNLSLGAYHPRQPRHTEPLSRRILRVLDRGAHVYPETITRLITLEATLGKTPPTPRQFGGLANIIPASFVPALAPVTALIKRKNIVDAVLIWVTI